MIRGHRISKEKRKLYNDMAREKNHFKNFLFIFGDENKINRYFVKIKKC